MSEAQEDKPPKKIRWTPEKVMSSSAVMISLISLVALFYQLNLAREENELIRKQQSASVLPHLKLTFSTGPSGYKVTFINKGVGPAFIKSVDFHLKGGEKFQRSDLFYNHVNEIIKKAEGVNVRSSTYSFEKGEVIPANEPVDIFSTQGGEQTSLFLKHFHSMDWGYTVIYEDVYGAQWKLSEESNFPVAISE